jgi:DNA-binding MarR family transcriptional regulator
MELKSMLDDQNSAVIKEIVRSIRRIVRSIYLDSKGMVKRLGLTGPQCLVLSTLASRGALSSADLSKELFVSPANMTGIIDRLEQKELIRRVKKQGDRRISLIELTDKGMQLSQLTPDPIEEKLITGLKDLEPTEVYGVYASIKKIVDLIEAQDIKDTPLELKQTSAPASQHNNLNHNDNG